MHELWPEPNEAVDIGERLAADLRPKPHGRPWVCMVMISSIDGAISLDGASGALGAPSDQERFAAARRCADGIVVGANTVSIEDYRPTTAPIAVVSGSLSLDPTARLFGGGDHQPLLFTTAQAARARGADFDGVAEVVDLGESIDVLALLADLDERGMKVVVLEGGPTLNGHFIEADLVDELLLSVSPVVVAGDAPRLVKGPTLGLGRVFTPDRVLLGDDLVFVRYLRQRR